MNTSFYVAVIKFLRIKLRTRCRPIVLGSDVTRQGNEDITDVTTIFRRNVAGASNGSMTLRHNSLTRVYNITMHEIVMLFRRWTYTKIS